MLKVATVGIVLVLGTGCATERAPLQAMLLPPVDGKLALWINQPAYFAVLGVGPERGTEVLYQQTALEGVPASGYIYVPMGTAAVPAPQLADADRDYEQVYLVASPTPIDLSAFPSARRDVDPGAEPDFRAESMRSVLASSQVVDGYRFAPDTIERVVCYNDRALPAPTGYYKDPDDPTRVFYIRRTVCPRYTQRSTAHIATTRTFFKPMPKLHPPGKGEPPRIPPGIEIKPTDRTVRYLAAKDEWHALTHNGQPGTELARAGYSSTWAGRPAGSNTSVTYSTRQTSNTTSAPTHAASSSAASSSAPSHSH